MTTRRSVYEEAGGDQPFIDFVNRFHDAVVQDPVLHSMYPKDTTAARRNLSLFFIQYFGGPTTYTEERGHPRLRARHMPFRIDQQARDTWMMHMRNAVLATPMPEGARKEILEYFENTATFLINSQTLSIGHSA